MSADSVDTWLAHTRRGHRLAGYGDARVLVVDDEEANLAILERLLREAGVGCVETLADPRHAVQGYLHMQADLILLDLHMPHLDGFEVMAGLQAALPEDGFVPIVVLTADSTPEVRDRALAGGATDFLTKPFDHSEVILRLRNLLETRALYVTVQRHNTTLQSELDARAEGERRRAECRSRILHRIQDVLAKDAIDMVFQPIVDANTRQILGVEALARFTHEPRRPPNEWFDEAATVGCARELEFAATTAALAHLDQLPHDTFLSINVSPTSATDPAMPTLFDGVPVDRIVLELTEHAPVEDYPALLACLEAFRARGMRIAVDDAGAGYAGLQHILRLRPDILKLDIDLTRGIDHDPARRALSTALVAFADEIQATIVAEGIETHDELQTLRDLGIAWGQGYYLARPGELPLSATHVTSP